MEFSNKGVGDKMQSFPFVTDPFNYYTFIDKALPAMTHIEQCLACLYDDQRSPAIAIGVMFTRVVL